MAKRDEQPIVEGCGNCVFYHDSAAAREMDAGDCRRFPADRAKPPKSWCGEWRWISDGRRSKVFGDGAGHDQS